MIRIEDFLHSLATVIVRYHNSFDPEAPQTPQECRQKVLSILQNKQLSLKTELSTMITNCTKDYPERKHLLAYLLNETCFLKDMFDREKPFTPKELEIYKTQLTEMLKHFSVLFKLTKSSSKSHRVRYSALNDTGAQVNLSGLKTNYFPYSLCKSGLLIEEEIFTRRRLSAQSSAEDISTLANKLCDEHQDHIKAQCLDKQEAIIKALTASVTEQTKKATDATAQIKKLTEELAKKKSDVTTLTTQVTTLKTELTQVKASANENSKKLGDEFAKTKADAEAQIKALKEQLAQSEKSVKELQASAAANTTPARPVYTSSVFTPGTVFFTGSMAKWRANQASTPSAGATPTSG